MALLMASRATPSFRHTTHQMAYAIILDFPSFVALLALALVAGLYVKLFLLECSSPGHAPGRVLSNRQLFPGPAPTSSDTHEDGAAQEQAVNRVLVVARWCTESMLPPIDNSKAVALLLRRRVCQTADVNDELHDI
ncbi:hypothetical protein NUW54_g11828 [Trametes sanguinea]|uniref:Uncharacterized protein n=1 Tax=Trametes sanguinea TaxID=158606 RepID=A0ACC1N6H7_9APHY|nr:hypothetical protein NUW54_g11828 [Trametes sanguinea]